MSNLSKKWIDIYIENEYHFVLECKQFDSLRKKYIPDIVYSSLLSRRQILGTGNLPSPLCSGE